MPFIYSLSTTIHSTNSQNQREINFESFLSNDECKQVFKEFLSRSKCDEIILFWDELNSYKSYYQQVLTFYKKSSIRKKNKLVLSLVERVNYIVNTFINSNSVLELNLDSKIKVRVCEVLESVNKKLSVEGDVFSMLNDDPIEVLTCTMDHLHPIHLFGDVETSVCIDLKSQIPTFIRSSIGTSFFLTKGAEFFNRMDFSYPTCQLLYLFNNSFTCHADEISHAIALGRDNAYTQWQCIKKSSESFPYELHMSQPSFGFRIAKLEMLVPIEKDELIQIFASMEFLKLIEDVSEVQCKSQTPTPLSEGGTPRNKEIDLGLVISSNHAQISMPQQVSPVTPVSLSMDLDSTTAKSISEPSTTPSSPSSPRIQLCTSSRLLTQTPNSIFSKKEKTLEYIQTTVYDPDIDTVIHLSKTLDQGEVSFLSPRIPSLRTMDFSSKIFRKNSNVKSEPHGQKQHFSHFLFQNHPVMKNSCLLVNIFSCESNFRCKQQMKARTTRMMNALNHCFELRKCQTTDQNYKNRKSRTESSASSSSWSSENSNTLQDPTRMNHSSTTLLDDPLGIIQSLQENNEKFPHKRWTKCQY
ncbi:hypothetical protein C9374_002887 [Naegleria lovaniensis]|uniref:RGS domain-containing protein n=1 Tax=Naegleria lovaniensis TaxID=51637 RepID=A0AA88GTH9_NAELO|nr:uncharacterized protein C9374_002887 [Naegleria lovaniensis]KAG2385738.1 hypothetical protein C9374_002887 [Naegleria lovaniensis]